MLMSFPGLPASIVGGLARLLCLAVLGLPNLVHAQQRGDSLALSADQRVAMGLRFAPLAPADAASMSLPGSVVVPPERQVVVASATGGLLTEVRVAVGDRVKAGQVLARLSSPQLVEMQREWVSARAQRELARDTLERDERLAAEGLIPQARVRAARARMIEAEALAAGRSMQLKLAGLAEPASTEAVWQPVTGISTPVAGIVIEASALRGQRVEPASSLFRIAHGSELWLELQAPPERAASIGLGDRVEIAQRGVSGRVTAIGAAVTAGQTVVIRARIEQGNERVRPGESLQATVRAPSAPVAGWRVPTAALAQYQGRTVLFVEDGQGVRIVEVQVQGRDEDGARVAGPLKAAQRVAVSGVSALKALASEGR